MKKTIVIGCDNAAVAMKEQLAAFIASLGYPVGHRRAGPPRR